MTPRCRGALFGALTGVLAFVLSVSPLGDDFEAQIGLAWLYRLRGSVTPPPQVAVVSIDRRSAVELGLPLTPRDWPRSLHGRLIDALVRRGAAVIAFDLMLERPQTGSEDRAFAEAIARAGRVVLFAAVVRTAPTSDGETAADGLRLEEIRRPLPVFADAARAVAPFPLPVVPSRVGRFWAFWHDEQRMPTLPVAALHLYAQQADKLALSPESLRDGAESYLLNLYGPPGTIRTIPYHSVLAGDDAEAAGADLAGTVVFVGYSELAFPTREDSFATVFTRDDGVALSGVEIAATAFANLLTDETLQPAGALARALLLPAFGAIVGVCAFALRPARAIAAAAAIAAGYAGGAQVAFAAAVWLPLAIPLLLQLPVVLFAGLVAQHARARRERSGMLRAIGYYVPEHVAEELADHPLDPIAVRKTAFATCLASDAENYTSVAEQMQPAAAAALLNAYFTVLTQPLQHHGADFREFHADSVLSAWVSDISRAAVRQRACLAALEMLQAVDGFHPCAVPVSLNTRIGLHAGEIFLGNVGAGGRFAFRLVGDIVNTTSRIEGLNKLLGTHLLATEEVLAGVDGLLLRPLGRFLLKGRQTGTPIIEILATAAQASPAQISLCAMFSHALQSYMAKRWPEAAVQFGAVLAAYPLDGPSRFYLRRISGMGGTAPQDKDIEIRLDSK